MSGKDIAEAVLRVGFPALTFAAVREELGVSESTLYRHAPDRDALVRLALEHAMSKVAWPSLQGPWREVLHGYAIAAWRMFEAYPGSATEAARGIVPPGTMRLMARVCAALMRQGFTAAHAVLAVDLVFDLVADNRRGVEHIDRLVPGAATGRLAARREWAGVPEVGGEDNPLDDQEWKAVGVAFRGAVDAPPLEWFSGKLSVVLDGIAQSLAPDAGTVS